MSSSPCFSAALRNARLKILTLFLQVVRLLSESRALTPPLKADFCYLAALDVGGFKRSVTG